MIQFEVTNNSELNEIYFLQEKHFPTVIREIAAFRYNKDARDIMPRVLQGICEAIEDTHGRLTPFVYEYNAYMRNRMKCLQEIVADRHFDEKMGSTFINVIDRKAILDAISSKSQNIFSKSYFLSHFPVRL